MVAIVGRKEVVNELEEIKQQLSYIKEHMADRDEIMTEEDYEALLLYRAEKLSRKLISHEQMRKELGL